MEMTLLWSISLVLAFSILVLLLCYRFRIPEVIGLLLTGVIAGPSVLGIFANTHEIDYIAEIGVVLLLFTIGMEFSFKSLLQVKKEFFVGGTLQVLFTFTAALVLSVLLGLSLNTAILIGFLIALSSTAIVLRLLQENDELGTPHGRIILGILIFQDVIAVPMMLVIPFLTGSAGNLLETIPLLIFEILAMIALVVVGTAWIVPKVLHRVARTRSQELFLLSVAVIGLAMAWLTSSIGMSMALGAFLAGLIISESKFSHQALGNILPFRYVFTSIFFVSIGMLLDIGYLISHPALILAAVVAVLLIKAVVGGATTLILGYPMRTVVLVGLALSQVGEFSFILSRIGLNGGLLSPEIYQFFLATSILTMGVSPFLMGASPFISDLLCRLPLPARLKSDRCGPEAVRDAVRDHIVIIGYGLNGRNLSRAAKSAKVPYIIIEMNPDTVAKEAARGEPIHYGDATNSLILEHANVGEARVVVIAISDAAATRRIITAIRQINPRVRIIVRTRYLSEMKPLYALGASEVIPEEFETSVEIFARVLRSYLVPRDSIDQLTAELRSENYEVLRCPTRGYALSDLNVPLSNVEIATVQVREDAPASGKSIKDVELRRKYGVTILMVQRDSKPVYNPDADTKLLPGDTLYLFGNPEKLSGAVRLFSAEKPVS
ncbi:MAG: Calcium-gated potassium channel MthK [Methanocella sp. PtaU1.Bin125]|nr:MAG: Calcium-gated potassium channel MthK [Methanocella sp. PtaU1.Bin125]